MIQRITDQEREEIERQRFIAIGLEQERRRKADLDFSQKSAGLTDYTRQENTEVHDEIIITPCGHDLRIVDDFSCYPEMGPYGSFWLACDVCKKCWIVKDFQ